MNQPCCSETFLAPPALPGAAPGAWEGPPAPGDRAGWKRLQLRVPLTWPLRAPPAAGTVGTGWRWGRKYFCIIPPFSHELMAKQRWDRGPGVMAAPVGRAGVTSKR